MVFRGNVPQGERRARLLFTAAIITSPAPALYVLFSLLFYFVFVVGFR